MYSVIKFGILSIVFAATAPGYAGTGGMDAGGGDAMVAEFVGIGKSTLSFIQSKDGPETHNTFDLNILQAKIPSVSVESTTEDLKLGGVYKEAINYPSQGRIVFSRSAWEKKNSIQKFKLAIHEYLSIAGIDDSNYGPSSALVQNIFGAKTQLMGPLCAAHWSFADFFGFNDSYYKNGRACYSVGRVVSNLEGVGRTMTDLVNDGSLQEEINPSDPEKAKGELIQIVSRLSGPDWKPGLPNELSRVCGMQVTSGLPWSSDVKSESVVKAKLKDARSEFDRYVAYLGFLDLGKSCVDPNFLLRNSIRK